MVRRFNWMLSGWANYFHLGQVSPAYAVIDAHASRRLRRWLCRKHKVRVGRFVRFPDSRLYDDYGLTPPSVQNKKPSVGESMISSVSRMRESRTSGLISGGLETRLWESA